MTLAPLALTEVIVIVCPAIQTGTFSTKHVYSAIMAKVNPAQPVQTLDAQPADQHMLLSMTSVRCVTRIAQHALVKTSTSACPALESTRDTSTTSHVLSAAVRTRVSLVPTQNAPPAMMVILFKAMYAHNATLLVLHALEV